jgi:hypothetical protein
MPSHQAPQIARHQGFRPAANNAKQQNFTSKTHMRSDLQTYMYSGWSSKPADSAQIPPPERNVA